MGCVKAGGYQGWEDIAVENDSSSSAAEEKLRTVDTSILELADTN